MLGCARCVNRFDSIAVAVAVDCVVSRSVVQLFPFVTCVLN